MYVTALEVFVEPSGCRRGRICRREDNLFQIVIEILTEPTEEYLSYWINEYPASGLFNRREDALAHLNAILVAATPLADVVPCTFDVHVGPYPEPETRTSE